MFNNSQSISDSSFSSDNDDIMDYDDTEIEQSNYICLMCENNFDSVNKMFDHLKNQHKIDINIIFNSSNIKDEYDWIKIINYLRKNITEQNAVNFTGIKNEEWKSDIYFQSVLEDDNLLFIDFRTICSDNNFVEKNDELSELKDKIKSQENTISLLRQKLTSLLDDTTENNDISDNKTSNNVSLTSEDKAYFTGYSHYSIHDIMIKDKVRTESYRKFIEENGAMFFKDKVVLDVGCGTGILSIFAARAGAKHVYGVDCADVIYDAMAIVQKNGMKEKITLIHGKLEDVGLPCEKVDIVISEWMGYFLIYESMLDSVLFACRKYLSPESGLVFPRYFTLNVLGADMSTYRSDNIDCWSSVYNIDMSCMKMNVMNEVIVDIVPQSDIITSSCLLRDYDVQQMAFDTNIVSPQIIDSKFELLVTRNGTFGAVVTYFDTYFLLPQEAGQQQQQVMFSTSPQTTATHWQQVVLMLDTPIEVKEGQKMVGKLSIDRYKHGKRGLDISLTIEGRHAQKFEFS